MTARDIINLFLVLVAIILAFILLRELIDVIDDDTVASLSQFALAAVTPMDVK